MDKRFRVAIAAYRERAATTFRERIRTKLDESAPSKLKSSIETDLIPCYKRQLFPALEDFLRDAAKAYETSKLRVRSTIKKKAVAQKLGNGQPVEALFASARRERWLAAESIRAHLLRAPQPVSIVNPVFCGIPADIREHAHTSFIAHCSEVTNQATEPVVHEGHLLGNATYTETAGALHNIPSTDEGYSVHIKRCKDIYSKGETSLIRTSAPSPENHCDTFEEVRSRYAGKPDELYRRKTARKFARWRRKRREVEQERMAAEMKAEKEMKRRRGYDQRLTSREAQDSSFAPFLFETDCHAYAYSTKITEAPKLRQVMIQKYNSSDEAGRDCSDQWERALQAARSTPLFHTRVMNRFS